MSSSLAADYQVINFERSVRPASVLLIEVDLAKAVSIRAGLDPLRKRSGPMLASVIHLAAYFDFTGEETPLYPTVNIDGTRALPTALRSMEVDQFL